MDNNKALDRKMNAPSMMIAVCGKVLTNIQ